MRTQLVNGLFADLLQVVRFLRVYCNGVRQFKHYNVSNFEYLDIAAHLNEETNPV